MKTTQLFTKGFLSFLFFLVLTLILPKTFALGESESKKVLILHWQDAYTTGVMNMDRILNDDIKQGYQHPIDIYTEYLQFSKFDSMDIQVDTLALLKKKYSNLGLDLIITTDDPDYQFAISYRNELFPKVPIVFIGVNKDTVFASQAQPNTTGNLKTLDVDATIASIDRLFPETKNLVVVSGAGRQDSQYYRILKEGLTMYSDRFNISYTADLTKSQMLELVSQLPAHTCIIYSSLFNDISGKGFSPAAVAAEIAKASHSPVFVYSQNMIGTGVVGGNVVDFATLGHEGASKAIEILKGASASSIPVTTPPNLDLFDVNALKKFGVQEKTLPKGSAFIVNQTDAGESRNSAAPNALLIYFLMGSSFGAIVTIGAFQVLRLKNRLRKS